LVERIKKMIIYATDLDRTLIYSERFLRDYEEENRGISSKVIEYKDGKVLSNISVTVLEEITALNSKKGIKFIPVTTRSINAYKRLNLGFTPEYAIAASGGVVLYNNEPLKEWETEIRKDVSCSEYDEIVAKIEELTGIKEIKTVDNSYITIKAEFAKRFKRVIEEIVAEYPKYRLKVSDGYYTVIHEAVSKDRTLKWLSEKISADTVVASGDGLLDIEMLEMADIGTSPRHGHLYNNNMLVGKGIKVIGSGLNSPMETIEIIKNMV
jgi:HAD superfamily hydrolase (TIGR01484 family)